MYKFYRGICQFFKVWSYVSIMPKVSKIWPINNCKIKQFEILNKNVNHKHRMQAVKII